MTKKTKDTRKYIRYKGPEEGSTGTVWRIKLVSLLGSQKRITLNNTYYYYVDIVFYNKTLRAYVLIDLKMGRGARDNKCQVFSIIEAVGS